MHRRSQTVSSPSQRARPGAPSRPRGVLPQLAEEPAPRCDSAPPAEARHCRPRQATWALTLAEVAWPQHWEELAPTDEPTELSTAACLAVVEELALLGIEEVTLAGGDGYWRHDWLQVVRAIRARDMGCAMTSGGRGFHVGRAHAVASAGVQSVSIALDGLEPTHDQRRGTPGAFRVGLNALTNLRSAGMPVAVHTRLRAGQAGELATLFETIVAHGAHCWELELDAEPEAPPRSLAGADHAELPALLDELERRCAQAGLRLLRGRLLEASLAHADPARDGLIHHEAGVERRAPCALRGGSLTIAADGLVTGCPSFPRESWLGGSVRTSSLPELWRTTPACEH
jgi:MoaA/NifB/PqqE/SkfB family radical SAM enzyme